MYEYTWKEENRIEVEELLINPELTQHILLQLFPS